MLWSVVCVARLLNECDWQALYKFADPPHIPIRRNEKHLFIYYREDFNNINISIQHFKLLLASVDVNHTLMGLGSCAPNVYFMPDNHSQVMLARLADCS